MDCGHTGSLRVETATAIALLANLVNVVRLSGNNGLNVVWVHVFVSLVLFYDFETAAIALLATLVMLSDSQETV